MTSARFSVPSSSEAVADQPIRHVHPSEALALNGMDCTLDFGLDVRLTLSGIGQIASPLQAAWIFGIVLSRVEVLSTDSVAFSPMSQLLAFRSWFVMKCQQVWPCTSCVIEDQQLQDMIAFWKPVRGPSLEQLAHPPLWDEQQADHVSSAAVLDMLIRQSQKSVPTDAPDDNETPWFEYPEPESKCDASFSVGSSEVTFVDAQGSCLRFRSQAGSTAADVLAAHAKLTGPMQIAYICDHFGQGFKIDQPIQAHQNVQIFFASDGTGISFAADEAHAMGCLCLSDVPDDRGETAADVSMEDPPVGSGDALGRDTHDVESKSGGGHSLQVSPTLLWSAQDVLDADVSTGVSQVAVKYPSCTGQVQALLHLSEHQFVRLAIPRLDDLDKFRALRQQFVLSHERLSLLKV